jgi:CO dehydrogenase maturation factor
VRIGFVGRARSGKTTCAAVFCRYLAAQGVPVLAVDATADRRLGPTLGVDAPPPADSRLRAHLTGPGGTPRVLTVDGDSDVCPSARTPEDVRMVAVTEAVGVLLDHLADGEGEYVVVDLPADAGASPRFDLTVLVSEPTRRAVDLYREHVARAAAHGAQLRVLGNKISDWGGAAWLTEQMDDALVGCVGHSAWIGAAERGTAGPIGGLEPGNAAALAALRAALDARRPALDMRRPALDMQQGDVPATGSQQCHPAVVGPTVVGAAVYSASSR